MNLNSFNQCSIILKVFENAQQSSQIPFMFEDEDRFIELCFDAEQCAKGWVARPRETPTRVSIAYTL